MSKEFIVKAEEIVSENSINDGNFKGQVCVLSLIDEEGCPTSSVITPSKSFGIKWITFCTLLDGNRAKRSLNCQKACVCFGNTEHCVNLVGEIEVITSSDVKHEMWYDALKAHVTSADDPNYCVLKFKTKRYKLFIEGQDVEGKLT